MKLILIVAAPVLPANAPAADLPPWRGADRHGISSERVSAVWSADGPNVLWRASIGTGFSSISISQGRAYTMGNTNNEDTIWCLDAVTRTTLWQHTNTATTRT